MANLVQWIEAEADGEAIEAVVIGEEMWPGLLHEEIPQYDSQRHNVTLSWEEARPMLNYEFDDGYGGVQCNPIIAWTKSWVISVSMYDGSTTPFRLPRNPVPYEPIMPGGG